MNTKAAYEIQENQDAPKEYVIALLVDNEFGVLGRVIGLFSSRGYNIRSLTVSEIDHQDHLSRITITTNAKPSIIAHIMELLLRLVPVHQVHNLTEESPFVARGALLVKIINEDEAVRKEAASIAEQFNARIIDSSPTSYIFELSDAPENLDHFVERMQPLGIAELSRTGATAMAKGARTIESE